MNKQENKQASYLTLLVCYTFFVFVLIAETLLLDWDDSMIIRLVITLIAIWAIHIYGKVPDAVKRWIYFAVTMIAYAFYGAHDTSFFDLAPVMIGIMMIYFAAGLHNMIYPCAAVYFAVMLYDLIFVMRSELEFSPLNISRILLHAALVVMAGRLVTLAVERRRQEALEMNGRIEELEETNRRTEDFLANVSHELRTPINAVTGITSIMLKNESDAEKRENIYSIQRAGHRLFRQIEDILDYTEIDTGRITVSNEPYMLSSLINDIITENRMMERKKGTELIFDIDAKVPSMLIGDGKKIKKIIKHLVDNAVKFTDAGGVYVRVYALDKLYGINLCITVQDTGIGMDEESLGRITEKFYQSDSGRSRRAGGLGLGIPIVYGMAAAMEGFVHIEAEEGKGMTVSVSIPQKISDAAPGMRVADPESLCLGCYFKPEKYSTPQVRKFYDEMISHIAYGLDVKAHKVFNMDELEMLISAYELTHLFTGREEYEENIPYFEELAKEVQVIVVADDDFELAADSRAKMLAKPFYCFPVVNVLNSVKDQDDAELEGKRMICPGVRVLVVDDEPMNLMVAEGIFRAYQMNVKTAGGGKAAVNICEEEDFDLIFLDHMMPEMDGVETLKLLRKIKTDAEHSFTVIAFTANAISGAREMFLREGFDEFLSKPIETIELERILKRLLNKSQIQYVDEKTARAGRKHTAEVKAETEITAEVPVEAEDAPISENGGVPEDDDVLARLEKAGINTSSGMEYCQEEVEFYLEILEKFVLDTGQKSEEIERLYGQKDYDNYRIQVHALKSTSKMIGADELSQAAKDMEDAAKQHDAAFIENNHAPLIKQYKETVRRIMEAADIKVDDAEEDKADSGVDISADELLEKLKILKESLDMYEQDKAQECLLELDNVSYKGAALKETLSGIKHDVEEFEFEAASQKTQELIGRVEGGVADE